MDQQTKQCTGCKQIKPLNEFGKDKYGPGGLTHQCKVCRRISSNKWKENNKDRAKAKNKEWRVKNKDHLSDYGKQYRAENPDYGHEYYENNKPQHQKVCRDWRLKHKEELLEKERERCKTDIQFHIKCCLRKRLYQAIKNSYKTGSAVDDLGCTIEDLMKRLESMFYPNPKTGEMMTWENYGEWHIDHIKPLAAFDLTDRDQLLEACNFLNLQPLWAIDNLSKGAKTDYT